MKKWTIPILLLFVMILSLTAVSAAEEISSDLGDSQDIEVQSTPASVTNAEDQGVLKAPENTEVLSDPETKNFTTLQDEIDTSRGTVRLDSNYVRAEGENDIFINETVVIVGNDYTIDANNLGGIFRVSELGSLILQNIKLVNGNATEGGAIYVEGGGYLSVTNSELYLNNASTGGAIYNLGEASITGSTLHDNSADDIAGAIYSEGDLSVKDTTFANNFAVIYGRSIVNWEGTLALNNVNCADNDGIYNLGGRITSKVKVRILNNDTVTVESDDVVINATVEDENGNTIIDDTLKFYVNDEEVQLLFDDDTGNYTGNYFISGAGLYTVNAVSSTGSTLEVETGVIRYIKGTYTDLAEKIDATGINDILNLTYDFKFVPEIDADLVDGIYIEVYKFAEMNGNGHTIDANGAKSIFIIDDPNVEVVIGNTTFVNAINSAIINSGNLHVNSSTFKDNGALTDGAAINNAGGFLDVDGCTFENNIADGKGGAIYAKGLVLVSNSIFNKNRGTGEAIFVAKSGSLTLSNSTFSKNGGAKKYSVYNNQGVMVLSGNTVDNLIRNIGNISSEVNATVLNNATIIPDSDDVIITAIVIDDNGNLIRDDRFKFVINNEEINAVFDTDRLMYTASYLLPGVGIYPVNMTSVGYNSWNVKTGTFNTAVKGTYTDLQNRIDNALISGEEIILPYDFTYNEDIDGANFPDGVIINGPVTIIGNGHTISGNGTHRIFLVKADLNIDNVTLSDANTTGLGGAICIQKAGITLKVNNSIFSNNVAQYGSGICDDDYPSTVYVDNCIFDSNDNNGKRKTTQFSGAPAIFNWGTLIVNNSVFSNNLKNFVPRGEAGEDFTHAAIWAQGTASIYNSNFTNNKGSYGGAICSNRNAGNSLLVDNCRFINNTAYDGGAIHISKGTSAVVKNSYFENNTVLGTGSPGTASAAGGAICINDAVSANISNCTFNTNSVGNTAVSAGGAIAIGNTPVVDISDCTFENNCATDCGGAIDISGSNAANKVTVTNCNFTDNSAEFGNAICFREPNSELTVSESYFADNGGVTDYAIDNSGTIFLSGNTIDNLIINRGVINTIVYAVVMDNKTYSTLESTFPINATLADDNGNLIYDPNFKFTVNGATIEDADYNPETGLYIGSIDISLDVPSYTVSVDDTNYDNLIVKVGIVKNGNIGTYTDLQAKINATIAAGLTEFVLPYNFTYTEEIDGGKFNSGIILTTNLTIIGNNNYIDGSGKVRAFDVEVDNVNLVGIEFRNGRAPNGGAIYTRSDLTVSNCTFINNTADVGNAIYAVALLDDVPLVEIYDSIFTDNGAYDDFAIYNNNSDVMLNNNVISNVIFNNGTITGSIVILGNETINATFGEKITLNATFLDDKENRIFDPNLVFLLEGIRPIDFTDFDAKTGLYTVTYVADTLGLLEVNVNIENDYVGVYKGFLNISTANVTLTVNTHDIIRKQNETISVSLYDLFGNPLNLTVKVDLYDANDVLIDTHIEDTVNGVFSYNIAINETGVYKVNAIFSSYGYELTSNVSSFFVDEYVLPGSYMDLQRKIDHAIYRGETTFVLPYDFSYIADCDEDFFPDGVVINAPINIDGNGSTISGNNSYRIFLVNASDVNITNVIFKDGYSMNGGAIYVSDEADNVAISSSMFTNNTAAWGGAIAWDGDNGIIDNCWFINNEASIPALTENAGGAIIWGGADGKITSSGILGTVFMNNTAVQGGAIFVEGDNFTIEQAGFIMNSAIAGGAIFWYADDGLINDSTFYANNATNGGGAIAWMGEFGLINASRFIQNNAISVGGAIVSNSSLLTVQSTDFTNNTAEYGGAIFTFNDLFVADSEFAGNTAEVANAIGVADGTLLLLNNTINTEAADVVVGDEGVIGSYVNVTILDNSTRDVVEDTYIIYAKITDDMGNLIDANGFEFVINDEETINATYNNETKLYEAEFNMPDEPGIYYVNMTYVETEILDTHIGILRYVRGTYTDLQSRIDAMEENETLVLPYSFAYTESIDGENFLDGVVIDKALTINGNNSVISGSNSYRIFSIEADNVNITDVVFVNGNASDDVGGAVCVDIDAENVTIADSIFVNNTALYGGAIYFGGDYGIVDGVWFINNTAETNGGAILWLGDYGNISGIFMDEDPLPTEMTLFINNTAGEKGGAIHVVGNNFTIENSGFMGNNATDGGAVSVVGSDVSIDHNMFIYNNAADGGAVYITEDAEGIIIDDSLFYANNATENGGAIYSEGKDLYVFDTHFYQNGALYGGAITTFNRTAIINSTFALNEAEYYGGAIYANDMLGVSQSKFEDNTAMFGNAILMGEGDLYLSENEINTEAADVVLTYNSAIDSDVNVTVLGNTTVEIFGFDAILNATVTDDNGNLIEAPYFKFIINDEEIDAIFNNETNLYEAEYTLPEISVYPVSMTYVNTENLDVYIGIISNLKTGTYTDLQRRINIALENGEDLVLPYNFTYNEAIDGDDFPIGVVIGDDLNIDANGFTISANNSDVNVLTIDEGCEVTIENAIITGVNGSTISFGAVANHGDLTLNNCTIIDNTITKASYGVGGAAIYNDGSRLVINGSYIINNTSPFEGSLAPVLIKESGIVIINDTMFADNSANLGGAIHVMLNQGPVIINGSLFSNNIAFEGQDILSDSKVGIYDSYFIGDRGDEVPASIVNKGSIYLFRNYVEGAVYNDLESTLYLDSNEVTYCIVNYGTITSETYAIFLDNNTLPAELGEDVLVYGTLTDDNGNFILDERFNITINDEVFYEDIFVDVEGKIYWFNYTIEYAGLNVISTTYETTVLEIGIFDVPKANVTEFIVVVGGQDNRIPYGENATVYVTLLGIDGIGLNETITVVVNDVPYLIDVIDGEAQFNVSGLEPGDYSATGMLINNRNYNDAYATGLFTILEPEAILTIEVEDTTVGEDLMVTVRFTDADGEPLPGYVTVTIEEWEDVIGLYGETTFYAPGLAAGNYTAYVTFNGDERYGSLSNNTTFQVTRIVDYDFIAEAEITPFDEQPVWVYIELPDFATGNVTITINGTTFNATVEDGEAIIVIDDLLDIGEYLEIEVAYSGDDIYAPGTTTVDIVVIPINPELEAELEFPMIAYLDNATIYAYVELGATGNILVYDHITEELLANVTVEEAEEGINIAGLSAGTYFFDVIYTGDDYYYADAVYELELEVIKIYPELNIEVTGDLVVDGEVNITFTTPEDADGFVSIYVDGEKVEYTGENGTYTVTINDFAAGTHSVMGVIEFDTNYEDDYVVDTFEISKIDPELEINVTGEAVADGNVTITIILPEDAEGFVLIDINDKSTYAVPEDGIVTVEIDDLAATIYEISVTYTGDDKYEEDWNFAIIDVAKANSTIEIYGPDEADVGEDFLVYVFVDPETVTGNYSIFIDGVDVTSEYDDTTLIGGEGAFIVSGLAAGNHTIGVQYNGDENYNASVVAEYTVEINKVNTTALIEVIGDEIEYGDVASVVVILPEDATRTARVKFGDQYYTAPVEEGVAVINISGLAVGEYMLEVGYIGDDKYDAYEGLVSVNVTVADPELLVVLEDGFIEYGEFTYLEIYLNESATGYVAIYAMDYATGEEVMLYNITVEEAREGVLIEELPAGEYIISAVYSGDNNFAEDYDYDTLYIIRTAPELEINVTGDLVVDGEVNITFYTPEDVDGLITILVDGYEVEYTGANGTYTVTINDLTEGTHTVIGYLEGDSNYEDSSVVETFYIDKVDPTVEIEVVPSEIITGGNATVTITVPEDATGYILVDINGESFYGPVEDGTFSVYLFTLEAGTYDIAVTYTGDDKYYDAVAYSNFTVGKASSAIEIDGPEEALVDEDFIVYVYVDPDTATGNFTVFIDGAVVEVEDNNIYDGEGAFIVSGLTAGNHTIGVQYNGDENYNASDVAQYTVEINKINTTAIIEVIGDEIEYGDVATVVVILPEDATRTARVKFGDQYYYADVVEGVAEINIPGLAVGEYMMEVGYIGDDKYEAYEGLVSVNVTVADPGLDVELADIIIEYGESTYLAIELNESATGYIVISAFSYETGESVELYNISVEGLIGVAIEGLPAGTYDISAEYSGDDNFDVAYDEDTLVVEKINPELDIEATGDLVVDGEVNITFTTPEDVDGIITILVDGNEVEYTGANGTYTVTLNNLDGGIHTVVGYLEGDSNYNDMSIVETFDIAKANATFNIMVDDINVGDDEIIIFVLPEDATGTVLFEIGETKSYAVVENGIATATISGLAEGNYTVYANYTGDDKYNATGGSASFEVTKVSNYNMTIDPSSEDGNITVDVSLPEDAKGTVTVTVNGTEYNATVENGNATVRVDNLPPGDTNVSIAYSGDDKYNPKNTTVTVENTKKDAVLSADKLEMYVKDGSQFIVTLKDTAGNPIVNRGIKVNICGKTYTIKTNSSGVAVLPINLKAGSYNVSAWFEGDSVYNASNNVSTSVEVYTKVRITDNKDLTKTYGGSEKFTVRALDKYGQPVGAYAKVQMTVAGKLYTVATDANGYASLPINLKAGKYSISSTYGGYTVVNTITVLEKK